MAEPQNPTNEGNDSSPPFVRHKGELTEPERYEFAVAFGLMASIIIEVALRPFDMVVSCGAIVGTWVGSMFYLDRLSKVPSSLSAKRGEQIQGVAICALAGDFPVATRSTTSAKRAIFISSFLGL